MLEGVNVPEFMRPVFLKAQEQVRSYFSDRIDRPSEGSIEICGQRYILVRAASMSVEFFANLKDLFQEYGEEEAEAITRNLLFEVAHAIGMADAREFHRRLDLQDPIEKLSAGPLHFAHAGWAFVDIHPESRPSPDKRYFLVYDHPYSFEADSWIRAGRRAGFPVCVMNSGYSSGWCEESFGLPLMAAEILCRARGDATCRFVMAPPEKIQEAIQRYLRSRPTNEPPPAKPDIAGFFSRKQERERRIRAEQHREKLIQELEAKNAELERFTYTVSHDLKSPLITVSGFLGLAEQNIRDGETQAALEDIHRVRIAAEQMDLLLDDLLKLSRIGRFMNQPEPVPLGDLVREAVDLAAGRIAQRGAQVTILPDLPVVKGDRLRLLEAVQNLLDNAVKFMGDQPTPRIEIGARRHEGETVVYIRDNGAGIAPEKQAQVFNLFEKLEGDSDGSGIGLALVQRIIEVHGGRIWVVSDGVGTGTTFCFTLGAGEEAPPEGAGEPWRDPPGGAR